MAIPDEFMPRSPQLIMVEDSTCRNLYGGLDPTKIVMSCDAPCIQYLTLETFEYDLPTWVYDSMIAGRDKPSGYILLRYGGLFECYELHLNHIEDIDERGSAYSRPRQYWRISGYANMRPPKGYTLEQFFDKVKHSR
jgi:hypothetical protein